MNPSPLQPGDIVQLIPGETRKLNEIPTAVIDEVA